MVKAGFYCQRERKGQKTDRIPRRPAEQRECSIIELWRTEDIVNEWNSFSIIVHSPQQFLLILQLILLISPCRVSLVSWTSFDTLSRAASFSSSSFSSMLPISSFRSLCISSFFAWVSSAPSDFSSLSSISTSFKVTYLVVLTSWWQHHDKLPPRLSKLKTINFNFSFQLF